MEANDDHDAIPTHRMWRIYACGWAAYLLLLALALQFDGLRKGHVDWRSIAQMFAVSGPNALFLALLWPLGGWLERRGLSGARIFLVHGAGALAYAVLSYLVMWLLFGFIKPLDWYVWPILYAMMTYGVIAALFHMVRNNAARKRQAAAMQQAQALLVAAELDALRSKLNPHFLFNTLHSIIALTRRDPAAAETALFQFSDMLRYVLDTEKTGNDRVLLDDELGFVRDYLELESLRLGARLRVDWELDDAAGGLTLPALSLQPLVENSIKHAFNPHSRPGRLLIRSRVDGGANALTLTVGDDGPGADPAAVHASRGLGIRTVDRRLRLAYGPRGGLAIATAPGAGFTVTMSIPLQPA
ncbi:sensor histidine kinase [uncultured Massilia sp.]|uniref:sensor histidine kinase n=1 Tax=uncultured Massilia sp. TaxID=169973 RepID=UPI0025DF4A9E|nr:histidine kinase [uncultured Massilia sp.]